MPNNAMTIDFKDDKKQHITYKHKVVRTYPPGWTITTEHLKALLNEGYTVVYITPLIDGIVEYIVAKYKEE